MPDPSYLETVADGVRLRLKVQPRASRSEIVGPAGDELRVRVTAPPVDAAANQAVLELLAEVLGCRRGAVRLIRGQTTRHKVVLIADPTLDAATIQARLRGGK